MTTSSLAPNSVEDNKTIGSTLGDAAGSVTSAATEFADRAKEIGNRAKATVVDQADEIGDRLRPKIDAVNDYVRTEPTKAMLIAAAAGAGLMALVALAAKSSASGRLSDRISEQLSARLADLPKPSTADTSDLVAALRDLVKRAPQAASDAADEGKKRASDAADIISDTWNQVRDQARPVIDRIRPQVDAVTAFAKEDPVKAAAGVALAGAVIAGITALVRSR